MGTSRRCRRALLTGLVLVVAVGCGLFGSVPASVGGEGTKGWKVPLGLEEPPVPADNPLTPEKVELGKQLYFDVRLSADDTVSCATCHSPTAGFSDGLPTSRGIKGQQGGRNAPTVINTAYNPLQFWDGRAKSLEEQALGPIQNPIEMGSTLEAVVKKLNQIEGYRNQFRKVFGTDVTADGIAKAIASFERTILSGNSEWDRFLAGDSSALSPAARRGWELFKNKANCTLCHVGFNLTDDDFHNLGVGMNGKEPDLGRYGITQVETDKGAFKTSTLRDIERTAPYMHDGSLKTLAEVIELYNTGGIPNPWKDPKIKPLGLTEPEKADLSAFLHSLNGELSSEAKPPTLPR